MSKEKFTGIGAVQVGDMVSDVRGSGRGVSERRRKCVDCGKMFDAKTTAKYCVVCRGERIR